MKMGMGERANVGGQRRRSEGSDTHAPGAFSLSQFLDFHTHVSIVDRTLARYTFLSLVYLPVWYF